MTVEFNEINLDESSDIEKDEEYRNKYLFCKPLDYHLMSNSEEVEAAAKFLLKEIGYTRSQRDKAYKTMRMLICNLYRSYVGFPTRYLRMFLSKNGSMKLMRRYNRLEINYGPLRKCIAGLTRRGYIEYTKGYFNKTFADGYQTRIRAEEKLVDTLESKFNVSNAMISEHPDQELIIKRTAPKKRNVTVKKENGSVRHYEIKTKKLEDYKG